MKITYFILLILFISCNSVNKSNPEMVVKAYYQFAINLDSKSCYELISTKSKEAVTYGEFKKVMDENDSADSKFLRVDNFQEQEKELNYPTFRRFRISETLLDKKDTIKQVVYSTLINENNEWKKVWNFTLLIIANEKYDKGDYDGAISICNKAIELNPFDAYAYERIAWCYFASGKINKIDTKEETLDKITSCLKHAISLKPDVPSHYNAMGQYYIKMGNFDLAMEYLKKALNLCSNKNDKVTFLSNIGQDYLSKNNFLLAKKYFNDALEIDSNHAYTLYHLGILYNNQGNYSEAIKYFEKDSSTKELPDNEKSLYYYSYAAALFNKKRNEKSKEYILKALELSPSDEDYKKLYELVK